MRKSLLVIMTSATLLVGGIAAANSDKFGTEQNMDKERKHSMKRDGTPKIERMARALDLTEEQITALDAAMSAKGVEMRQTMRSIGVLRHSLAELDPTSTEYQASVDALKEKAAASASQMMQMHADQRKIFAEILTPEQLTKLTEMKDKMAKRGDHHGKNHKKGMPEEAVSNS